MQRQLSNRHVGCLTGPQCPCGALASDAAGACEKCASRARWVRRKTRRTFEGDG